MHLRQKTRRRGGEGGGCMGEGEGGCRTIDLLLCLICYCDIGGGEYTDRSYQICSPQTS